MYRFGLQTEGAPEQSFGSHHAEVCHWFMFSLEANSSKIVLFCAVFFLSGFWNYFIFFQRSSLDQSLHHTSFFNFIAHILAYIFVIMMSSDRTWVVWIEGQKQLHRRKYESNMKAMLSLQTF